MSESPSTDTESPSGYSHFWNPLGAKLEQETEHRVAYVVCAWSDLLGFGRPFAECAWHPDQVLWQKIAERLHQAYQIHCKHTPSSSQEFMLVLNDGAVRTRVLSRASNECLSLALWLRAAIWSHLDVLDAERKQGLPGPRTVITGGQRAFYSFPEVRLDDIVINYTRKDGGLSKIAKETGNPLLVSNPAPLQMNTAFSRAYILDEAGSKAGLAGANVFIEQSLLDLIDQLCALSPSNYRATKQENETDFLYAVEYLNPPEGRPWCLGFLLDRLPGKVSLPTLATNVFRLKKFFPNDEHPNEFCFDLESAK